MAVIFSGRKETAKEEVIKEEMIKKIETNSVEAIVESSSQESAKLYCSKDECGPKGPKGIDDSAFVTGCDRVTEEDRLDIEFVHITPKPNSPIIALDNPEPVFNDNAGAHGLGAIFDEEEPERDDDESEED